MAHIILFAMYRNNKSRSHCPSRMSPETVDFSFWTAAFRSPNLNELCTAVQVTVVAADRLLHMQTMA